MGKKVKKVKVPKLVLGVGTWPDYEDCAVIVTSADDCTPVAVIPGRKHERLKFAELLIKRFNECTSGKHLSNRLVCDECPGEEGCE